MPIPVENRAGLPADRFNPIRAAVEGQTTLERALNWLFAQTPPLAPEDLVPQDEFSFDLLVPYPSGFYLSYDTS
jgi:hypothetical protein